MCYKMQPMDTESNDGVSDQMRSWTDLPFDILSDIANRLTIIELLSFRGTCKDFRYISAVKSAEIQSSLPPWIFTFQENNNKSKCILHNNIESKTYKRKIPELENVICLASYKGWLLLFKEGGSIFFFCPISLTKIPLPEFPQKTFDGHVASFSDAPTSAECIVTVINRADSLMVEVNVISKGEKSWTQHMVTKHKGSSTKFTVATFVEKNKTFYFMDDADSLLTFSVREKKWKPYQIVSPDQYSKNTEALPYFYKKGLFGISTKNLNGPLELENDEDIAVCGFTYENYGRGRLMVYLNEYIDTLPVMKRLRRAVWIQPRFFEAYRNHCW